MFSTKRHNSRLNGLTMRRVLQTWLMAFVILFAGVTQSGLVPALLSGQATGISSATASEIVPGSDYLLICTPNGIKLVSTDQLDRGVVPTPDRSDDDGMAGHGFCPLCANHHGAMVAVELLDVTPVAISHDVTYARANGIASGHSFPRIRHSRAPPVSV